MKGKRLPGLLLTSLLCICLTLQVSASSIDEAKKKEEELKSQKEQTEQERSDLEKEMADIAAKMQETSDRISAKEKEIVETEEKLTDAKITENNQYEDMKKRIRYMYENGDFDFVEILCQSKSIGEFLNNAEYINTISKYDRDMLTEFQKTVKTVEEQEAVLKKEYEELSTLQDDLSAQKESVRQMLASANTELADLEKKIGENASLIAELVAEAERQRQAQIAYEESLKAAVSSVSTGSSESSGGTGSTAGGGTPVSTTPVIVGSGQFAHPCPASTITSYFGEYRDASDPFHKGMDFGAGTGTPTYAADNGTVVIAGYSASAGNWIVINHGNGMVTKYMHHSEIYVGSGQQVVKGQQIGAVGSTGWSTGPHLHFQVELNGSIADPMNYL